MNRNKWNVRNVGVLMEVFMEGLERSFSCLKDLVEENRISKKETIIYLYYLKTSNFYCTCN